MVLRDVDEDRQEEPQRDPVLSLFQIAPKRMKEPEGRVRSVIEAFLLPVRKHVRDQSIADVVRESSQDVARLERAAGDERQTFQADHRVAPPIGEPVIACDHRANFVPGRMSARRFLGATGGSNHELVASEDQFRGDAFAGLRVGIVEQPRPPLAFRCQHLRRTQDVDNVPWLGRTDQRRRSVIRKIDLEKSRAPQLAFMGVTPGLLRAINDLVNLSWGDGEGRGVAAQSHPQSAVLSARGNNFVTVARRA